MADTLQSLREVEYLDQFKPCTRVIEEKAHELACDHLYEYPFLTYNQAREETEQNVEIWVEQETNFRMMVNK